jgi:hypothetical protein
MTDTRTTTSVHGSLGTVSAVLGGLGLLPIPGFAASVAAIVCGGIALRRDPEPSERARARAGVALGTLGVALPVLALFVYCVVLGYPFPIHRYHG